MNKRLIVVNLLLIILLSVLPKQQELLTSKAEVKELAQEVFKEKQVSRSLEESREVEPQIVIATDIS